MQPDKVTQSGNAATSRESVIAVWEGDLLPEFKEVVRILATEEVPVGTGTATRRKLSLLVRDTRYWLSDAELLGRSS